MTPPRRKRRTPKPQPPPPPPVRRADGEEPEPKNPERLYTVAGSEDGARAELDLVTLIVARDALEPATSPEQGAVLRLCANPMSVAELSAYLNLPFSAMTVLLTELITAELVQVRAPVVRRALPDRSLLEAVMHGLQRL